VKKGKRKENNSDNSSMLGERGDLSPCVNGSQGKKAMSAERKGRKKKREGKGRDSGCP